MGSREVVSWSLGRTYLEEYFEGVHKDREGFREMGLPADIPPIGD